MLQTISLLEHVSQFNVGDSMCRNGGNMLLKAQKGVPESVWIFDGNGKLVTALKSIMAT